MKLSDFNLKDPVHRRLCRFIIERYFGQFLERNLVLDQLSLSLFSGSLNIHDVNINVHYVNELLTSLNVPLKLIDGFIGGISIEVPWMSLVSDATKIRINDLQLTFQAKEFVKLDDKDLVSSMIGSVVESFVSSTELAKSFYEHEQQMGDSRDMEGQDGVMAFTKIIDAVVSRLCLEFNETTIRLENPPKTNSKTSTAMEIRIQEIKFMDEQMKNCEQEGKSAETITSQPQGIGSITNLNKFLNIKGVTFYTDIFSQIDDQQLDPNNSSLVVTSMYIRREKQKQKSPTHSSHEEQRNSELFMSTMSSTTANFHSCYSNFNGLDYSTLPTTSSDNHKVMNMEPDLVSNPIKFAEILDESNMIVRIRNSDSQADQLENKIEVEIFFKRLNVFITPTQVDIVKRFFSSLAISQTHEKALEHGKRMKKSDYDAMVKNIEETSFQNNQIHGVGVRGNWNQREDFHEFDSVNLEDNRYSRKFNEQSKEGYKSIKNDTGKRESTHLKATFGIILVCIPHHDLMSSENVQKLENSNDIIDKVLTESESFFNLSNQFKPLSNTPLHSFRKQLDKLYDKDHLRFVGSSVVWNHQIDKNADGEHMSAKLIVTNADCIEYLTDTSNPFYTQSSHIPLLDFSNFENIDQDPHLKIVFTSSSVERGKSKIHIYVGNCQSELDLSLIDRISDLIVPRPFFDNSSFGKRTLGSLCRVDNFQLSDELFNTVSTVEKKEPTLLLVSCMDWNLNFRVPKADMRDPSEARISYHQRNIHAEYLALRLKSASIEIPIGDECTSVELLCSEITGDFRGLSPDMECSVNDQFLHGTQASTDDKIHIKFEYDLRNRSLKTSGTRILAPGVDDMTRSISLSVMQSLPQREGPFSQTRLSFSQNHEEDNDLIQAGTREEMMLFGNACIQQSASTIHIDIPILRFYIPNHSSLEVLYNRLVNDLVLWQPRAPALRPQSSQLKINAFSDEIFQECRADGNSERYTDDEELMDERSHLSCDYTVYERNKMHNLSLMLNIKKGTLLMGTIVKENDVKKGLGQISVELCNAQLFTVAGYHGQLNETFFYFTTNTVSIGQRNFSCTIPKSVNQKDFGKWIREDTQLETIGISDEFSNQSKEDVLGVAVHLHNRSDSNVKDILLAIAVRNTCVQLRPFRDSGHIWITQLANLFTLKDYEIPGYKLPLVTTDLHVHLENVVLAYDHSWVNSSCPIRLRLVLDQTNISSAVIQDMNVSKFVCIFEGSHLFISNQKKSADGVCFDELKKSSSGPSNARRDKQFIQVVDVGLFQLEVLLSLSVTCDLNGRRAPMVEIRCSNDIVKAWTCSDSLVALINIVTEISNSEKMMAIPSEIEKEDQQRQEYEDDSSSEGAASICRSANSSNPLPKLVEMKMKRMLESAMQERSTGNIRNNEANLCSTDALNEFSQNYSFTQEQKEFTVETLREDDSSDRNRAYSLSTDDEFCMVDDIIGSGITSSSGEPCIKYIGSRKKDGDSGIIIDPQHFRVPNDWRGDGLGALPSHFPHPLIRYLVRDFSIRLHLYAGSDLSEEPPKPRNYSVEEYREGKGKNQKITSDMMGGKYRDQSVSVVLDLDKITFLYQMFNKDAPLMCTTLFSVYNITLLDKLQLSSIKEMMYQYNNAGQPRRTCAPMLAIRIVETHTCEGKMRISMLPVKFNIDQDTMEFLEDFIHDVTSTISLPSHGSTSASTHPVMEIPSEHSVKVTDKSAVLSEHNSLNLEPLRPSPVALPSPLGDLSFLENRSSGGSPVKRPLIDAPLTASAVSIGDLFVTKSSVPKRVFSSESEISSQSSSPDLIRADPVSEDEPFLDNLKLEGDWNSTTEIRFHNPSPSSVDQILMQSAMKLPLKHDLLSEDTNCVHEDTNCVHEDTNCVHEDLVDTNSDFDVEIDGDKSTICGEDSSTHMCYNSQRKFSHEGDDAMKGTTFFKEFVFSPAVSIYVDYHGKNKINMEKSGAVMGVLKGIGQLNRTEIVLKEIIHRNGLLGAGRCINFAINEWADDIISKLPNVLASYGPISPLVQIGKGVLDLFWLPVVELRKEDGHVVKGIQKGMGSFGLSSAAGIVGIAQTVVGVVQMFAESVLHEVQPNAPYLNQRNRRAVAARAAAPSDLRHGMQLAYDIVADGVRQTRSDLELAAQEDRASGHSSLRSVLRFATPAVIRPLVVSSQISYQILGGLRNQLRPDVYQDERHKWRDEEIPGGSGRF